MCCLRGLIVSSDNHLDFHDKIMLVVGAYRNICILVEILTNFVYHHLQNDFYHENKFNQMFLIFFNSFSMSKCLILFEVIFLLRLHSFALKSVFVTKFACVNLAAKFSVVNLSNLGVVIYLS